MHIIFLDNRKIAPLYFLPLQAMPDKDALGKQDRSMTKIHSRKQQGGWKMKSFRLIRLLAVAVGIAIFISVPAWANKSETAIDVPDSAVKGSEITVKVTVTHNANSFLHYTEWLWVQVNGKEVGRWDFGSKKPEGSTFTREIKVKVDGDLDIKAKANCNLHGSANEAAAKVTVK
jgi:desulfoferrodoxin (superoxide reductase-like protein)